MFVADSDARSNINSDMLISECEELIKVRGNLIMRKLCSNAGDFDISCLMSLSHRLKSNAAFVRGTRCEEAYIYSLLENFIGVMIVKNDHAYCLIRNPAQIYDWVRKDSLASEPEKLERREVLLECSNKNVWYILDDSRITYEENSDFKRICLEKFLKLTLRKDRKV